MSEAEKPQSEEEKPQKDCFRTVAELAFTKQSIAKLATAIEMEGFYTWDRFGRYIKVPPVKVNEDAIHKRWRDRVLNELAKGRPGDEEDCDYFYEQMCGPTILNTSGWTESKLPDFEKLQIKWNQKNLGENTKSIPSKPVGESGTATQSKVWIVLAGLIELQFGKEVLEDLRKEYSAKASVVCNKLSTVEVNIEPKTLKSYLSKGK